jgi:hypothetical protein
MTSFDPRTQTALEQLRREWSPPPGSEDAMLAHFHARLGDGGPPEGSPDGGLGGVGELATSGAAKLVYAGKIAAAITGLSVAGVAGLWLVGVVIQGSKSPPREQAVLEQTVEVARAEPAVLESPASVVELSPAPVDELAAPELEASPTKPRARSPASSEPGPDLAAELALIRAAREAAPREALRMLERHRADFPDGALVGERESLEAVALCQLERTAEATAAIERLVASNPSPLLRDRVRSACAKKIDLATTALSRAGDGSH